jgi:hypothetical protein
MSDRLNESHRLLLVFGAALISACGASSDVGRGPTDVGSPPGQTPGGPPSGCTECPPSATGGPYSISGVLTLRTASGTAPLSGTPVGGFVITNDIAYPMGSVTDSSGRYQFSNVPNGQVVLYVGGPPLHAYQPCAAVATVSGANAVQDIELVDSAVTRPETSADSPTLSGVVYRSTGAGRQPVAGVVIEFDYSILIAATTITDAQGRYSLCHLPTGRGGVDLWLNGFAVGGAVLNISGDQVLDIDLR